MTSWMVAKTALYTAMWWSITCEAQATEWATHGGIAVGRGLDDLGDEGSAEHEGLELESGVEEPNQPEGDLQRSPTFGQSAERTASYQRRARRRHA